MTPKKDENPTKRLDDLRDDERRCLLDIRVTERYVRKGALKPEELKAALEALPDLEDQVVSMGGPCPSLGGR